MEKEMADMLAEVKADAFVLDCFAYPATEQITVRTAYFSKNNQGKASPRTDYHHPECCS